MMEFIPGEYAKDHHDGHTKKVLEVVDAHHIKLEMPAPRKPVIRPLWEVSPVPVVEMVDGTPVLHDPAARGVAAVLDAANARRAEQNCLSFVTQEQEALLRFVRRAEERGDGDQLVITLINVDDSDLTSTIADVLMPGADWDVQRKAGLLPIARGLAARAFFAHLAQVMQHEVLATALTTMALPIIVMSDNTVLCFDTVDPPYNYKASKNK